MSEQLARAIVRERAGGVCELCRDARATDWAHRIGRGQGGLWIPSNGIHACRPCHHWTTVEPVRAELGGWRIESTGEHPATVPVWLHTWLGPGWHLLDDEGCIEQYVDRDDVPVLPPAAASRLAAA